MSQDSDGYYGTQQVNSATAEYNAMLFVVSQILAGRHHVAIVRVIAATSAGQLAKPGTVDVQPMVSQLDGMGNAVPHGVVNGLPYVRLQGGTSAFILDPAVGDIGLALFADRDVSTVKNTGNFAAPGSLRQNDMADGIYLGGLLNGAPTQYVQFNADGITISSPGAIVLVAPTVTIDASTSCAITSPTVMIDASDSCAITAAEVTIDAETSCTVTTATFTVNGTTMLNGPVVASGTIAAAVSVTAPSIVGTTDVSAGGKSGASHVHGGVQGGTSSTLGPT